MKTTPVVAPPDVQRPGEPGLTPGTAASLRAPPHAGDFSRGGVDARPGAGIGANLVLGDGVGEFGPEDRRIPESPAATQAGIDGGRQPQVGLAAVRSPGHDVRVDPTATTSARGEPPPPIGGSDLSGIDADPTAALLAAMRTAGGEALAAADRLVPGMPSAAAWSELAGSNTLDAAQRASVTLRAAKQVLRRSGDETVTEVWRNGAAEAMGVAGMYALASEAWARFESLVGNE